MQADILTLSQQCETAGPEETRGLLKEAFALLFPAPALGDEPEWPGHGLREPRYHHWYFRKRDFRKLLDINTQEAFLGAAMMLVPEGWFIYGMGEQVKPIIYGGDRHDHLGYWAEIQRREGGLLQKAEGSTQANTLLAAILRAEAAKQVQHNEEQASLRKEN